MSKPKNNSEVQLQLKKFEAEILQAIAEDFPMMEFRAFGEYDLDDEGNAIGYFLEAQTQNLYSFFLPKEEGNLMLQKVALLSEDADIQ